MPRCNSVLIPPDSPCTSSCTRESANLVQVWKVLGSDKSHRPERPRDHQIYLSNLHILLSPYCGAIHSHVLYDNPRHDFLTDRINRYMKKFLVSLKFFHLFRDFIAQIREAQL